MDAFRLSSGSVSAVLLCDAAGHSGAFISTCQPIVSFGLSVVSFISVLLIIVVNVKKLRNEKRISGD